MPSLGKTSYNQFIDLASEHQLVALTQSLPLNCNPISCLRHLQEHFAETALVDFYTDQDEHYTFIGFNPLCTLKSTYPDSQIIEADTVFSTKEDPFQLLRQLQRKFKPGFLHPAARLTGAALGFLGYDAIQFIEKIPNDHINDLTIPDINIYFFSSGIYFDYKNSSITISHVVPSSDPSIDYYQSGMKEIDRIIQIISKKSSGNHKILSKEETHFDVSSSDQDHINIIKKAKNHIKQGDIFQIVLSRTFSKDFYHDPLDLYQHLITSNPSPYQFYLKSPSYCVIGASPEKIIRIKNSVVTSTPLGGTKPRQVSAELIQELLNDQKEVAEHMMLVDLARNDIGKVCKPGSVKPVRLKYPLTFSQVIHIASDIQGILSPQYDAIDALKSAFPAGTLSGSPKIRAMQLINELESSRRGLYGGCIVALDHYDNLDTCIIIRSAIIANQKIYVRAGGGIVYDSNPSTEVDETRHKANAVLKAIQYCEQQG